MKPPSRGSEHTTWLPRLKSRVHMLLHSALKQMSLHSLTSGTLAPFLQEWTTLHQQESRWKLAPDSPTNGGDHLCIDGSPATATTSDQQRQQPPLRAACQQQRPPQGERRCERSSPPSSYRGDNEAIKAKESGTQRQVALMVPIAEATTSARGSLTSGSHHLSTDDHGHLRTRGPRSRSLTE